MQGNADQKKQHEATIAALTSSQPPPPPGGGVTASTQGSRAGSSTDSSTDSPMSVAPDILSNVANPLMSQFKLGATMEPWMDRRKQSAPRKALDTHLGEAGKRRSELHKSMTNYFRSAEFNRTRLAIEVLSEGFKQHI